MQLGPDTAQALAIFLPTAFGSIIVTVLILRYKLKQKELEMRGSDSADALRDDLDDTRAQLADMQERLDFAERLLTAGRASQDEKSK